MCEKYSWIKKNGGVLFLTADQVYNSKRGHELRNFSGNKEDYHGHGAIEFYYGVKGGTHKECADFSTPDNFPPQLVEAIKSGEMWGFGITQEMTKMLCDAAYAEYQKVRAPAYAEYQKVCAAAFSKIFANPKNRIKSWQ